MQHIIIEISPEFRLTFQTIAPAIEWIDHTATISYEDDYQEAFLIRISGDYLNQHLVAITSLLISRMSFKSFLFYSFKD